MLIPNRVTNKIILLLRNCVYPFEYVDDWESFNKTSLPQKDDFYSHLNMEAIIDADYTYTKRVCKDKEFVKMFG